MLKQKYEIGTKFNHYARKSVHTIVDVYKTFNSKNELVDWAYIVSNELMGQKITGPTAQSTIDRSEVLNG